MTRPQMRILRAFTAFVFVLFAAFGYAQDAGQEFDSSLLNLPTDRDASFYRESFEKLTAGAHDVLHTAKSFPDLVRDVTPFATSAKVVFERLASSTDADDVAASLGRPRKFMQVLIEEALKERDYANLFIDTGDRPLMATLKLESGTPDDAAEVVDSLAGE